MKLQFESFLNSNKKIIVKSKGQTLHLGICILGPICKFSIRQKPLRLGGNTGEETTPDKNCKRKI
jgi:hypothetical protein